MSAHTPGRWVLVDRRHWSASIAIVVSGKPTPVAWASRLTKNGDTEAEANARLIAAAPSYAKAWAMVPEEIRERILSAIDSRDAEAIDRAEGSTK